MEGDAVTQLMLSGSYHTQGVLVSITPLWKSPLLPFLFAPRDSILAVPLSRNDKGGCKEKLDCVTDVNYVLRCSLSRVWEG